MKKIIMALQHFFGFKQEQTPPFEFAHTVSWMKLALDWSSAERTCIRTAVESIVHAPDFTLTQYQRRYAIPELDEREYAGESLVALLRVLDSLDQSYTTEE